jgi:hypothetical protein
MAKRRSDAIRKGDAVVWDGRTCRVLRRRRVSGMASFSTADVEVFLETLAGDEVGWVGENEAERINVESN